MKKLINSPTAVVRELLEGLVSLDPGLALLAEEQVILRQPLAATGDRPVAVISGGGSGHEPAHAGYVGEGMLTAAVAGDVFTSPSVDAVLAAIRAAAGPAGALLVVKNYTGDRLNFGLAAELARSEGIPVETVLVADDAALRHTVAPERRRGIAGTVLIHKLAGAAAAAGRPLAEVAALARAASAELRSMGVALGACTVPAVGHPGFQLADDEVEWGLGIHGEQGVDETDVPSAEGLAELFVSTLLDPAEVPEGVDLAGARVVPILNGLGSVKTEELFVVYRTIARLLGERGATVVDPQVGEFCTSFDMAGASLTLLWLDDELERLWLAPTDTPAFRRGAVADDAVETDATPGSGSAASEADTDAAVPPATDVSRKAAAFLSDILSIVVHTVDRNADEWGRLDSIAGDGDHGSGMQRGATAARIAASEARDAGAGARTLLTRAAAAWADRAGGTSGALWGLILRGLATELSDDEAPTAEAVAAGVARGRESVMGVGKAAVGDKTMVDAIVPFDETLRARLSAGDPLAEAWSAAADAAETAAADTAGLMPRLGRARTHGDKAVGTPDPGAVSFAALARAVATALA
jgi:dihydroxyacetone kinase